MPGVSGNIQADSRTLNDHLRHSKGKLNESDARYAHDFASELRSQGKGEAADKLDQAAGDGKVDKTEWFDVSWQAGTAPPPALGVSGNLLADMKTLAEHLRAHNGSLGYDDASYARDLAGEARSQGANDLADKLDAIRADGNIDKGEFTQARQQMPVGSPFEQASEGTCGTLSLIKSMANTPEGRKQLNDSVTINDDGSADVALAADKDHPIHMSKEDLDAAEGVYAKGGPLEHGGASRGLVALAGAMDKYMGEHQDQFATDSIKVKSKYEDLKNILLGRDGKSDAMNLKGKSTDEIEEFIRSNAPQSDSDNKMVNFSGAGDEQGKVKAGGGHLFSLTKYDQASDTVTYVNPWDSDKEHTTSLHEFAQLMQSSGDVGGGEMMSLRPGEKKDRDAAGMPDRDFARLPDWEFAGKPDWRSPGIPLDPGSSTSNGIVPPFPASDPAQALAGHG